MLTIFSCPKAFADQHIQSIQRNAIESRLHREPRPENELMGENEGVAEIDEECALIHIRDITENEYGTLLCLGHVRECTSER